MINYWRIKRQERLRIKKYIKYMWLNNETDVWIWIKNSYIRVFDRLKQ